MKILLALLLPAGLFAQTAVYPGRAATAADLKVQVNGVQTKLSALLSATALTATVASCTGIGANTLATIDREIMEVSGCGGLTLTLTSRHFDGTTATAHASGATVSLFVDAWHHNALAVEIEALEQTLLPSTTPTFSSMILSGSSSGDILTVTQSGAGRAVRINGPISLNGVTTATEVKLQKITFLNGSSPDWVQQLSSANLLGWYDSGGLLRMSLDAAPVLGGVLLTAPAALFTTLANAQPTVVVQAKAGQTADLLRVTSPGGGTKYLKVNAAGVTTADTLVVSTGGSDVTGASFFRTGIQVTAGSIIQSGGGTITSGAGGFIGTSLTVSTGGVDVTGASFFRTGIQVTAGSIVQSGGGAIYSGSGGFIFGAFPGVTSATCSQFKGGICTAP